MAYSASILPRSAAYYSLSNASISNGELILSAGGSAEIQVSNQMLPKLTSKMLVVVHPSQFSNSYTNDSIQVTLSIITSSGVHIEYLIPVTYSASGVFNTTVDLPEETFASFIYKISSKTALSVYNWELCAEEAVDVTTVIDGVEQSLPKLLYDYNTYSYAVSQSELTVGLISCYLLDATDLQGHFTISFFATERCNVHIRIKDNGITELYSPIVYTVEKGYTTVSVPHAYLKKLATDHVFSVTLQCTNGQLSIPVRGMLYTIDGGYLATRLLDAGVDIEDISIKQLPTETEPSEIWAVGFEGNRLLLKKRSYKHTDKEDWQAIKDFGEGLHAGVEFSGSWAYRSGEDKFTIETEETPHVLILSTDGTLIDYYGEAFDTRVELDTDVTWLSICKGFNSIVDIDSNQGMILAYIKSGNVYYMQWLPDDTHTYSMWYGATALYTNGDASFVSVHRLPDYRMGICVQHSNGATWYITDRTYVGQGIKPEVIRVPTDEVMISSVYDSSNAPDNPYWVAEQNIFNDATSYNVFTMSFAGKLVFLRNKSVKDLEESLVVTVNGVAVESIISLTSNVITVTLKEAARAGSTVLIEYNCPYIAMIAYTGCYAEILQSYSWVLPIPTSYNALCEHISASTSATIEAFVRPLVSTQLDVAEEVRPSATGLLDTVVSEIITNNLVVSEAINASVASTRISITVSQVGTTPI